MGIRIHNELEIGVENICKIINKYLAMGFVKSPNRKCVCNNTQFGMLDNFDQTAIQLKVHKFFRRNEVPTIDKLLKEVNDDPRLPNFKRSTFHR